MNGEEQLMTGDGITVMCWRVAEGVWCVYRTPDGSVFRYWVMDRGRHFCPWYYPEVLDD